MPVDPYHINTSLLLNFDGAHGSTAFADSSPRTKTVTAYGGAAISTVDGGFGGSCLSLAGSGSRLVAPANDDYIFGDGDFTVEAWFKPAGVEWGTLIFGGTTYLDPDPEDDESFTVRSEDSWFIDAGENSLFIRWGVDDDAAMYCSSVLAHDGRWHHVAVARTEGLLRVFLDGEQIASSGSSADYWAAQPISIGATHGEAYDPDECFVGSIDDVRITKGVARYITAFDPFAGKFSPLDTRACIATAGSPLGHLQAVAEYGGRISSLITAQSMLGQPQVSMQASGAAAALASAQGPLGRAKAIGHHDFTGFLGDTVSRYVMDLVTPTGSVRVPISSWQATLQTGSSNYVQCVIPACDVWQEAINAATEFVIYRRAVLPVGAAIEYEMARAPAGQLQFDRGPQRNTCTVSGYSDAFAASEDPPAIYDRALTGVRSISSGSSYRVRCAVDWLLRPGHRAYVNGAPFIVKFINYYAPSSFDSYMDVGG